MLFAGVAGLELASGPRDVVVGPGAKLTSTRLISPLELVACVQSVLHTSELVARTNNTASDKSYFLAKIPTTYTPI